METPLQRARTVARRDLNARTAASVARYKVPAARRRIAATKIQSQFRRGKATRKANAISNSRIPGQITALSSRTFSFVPKDLSGTLSELLLRPAGKTKKVSKNKKGGGHNHIYHDGGMGCGSHGSKKSRRSTKSKKNKSKKKH